MNARRSGRFLVVSVVVVCLAVQFGCAQPPKGAPKPEVVSERVVDTDRDGLPDDLETALGTDPKDFDADNDGLGDGFELIEMPKRLAAAEPAAASGVAVAYAAEPPAGARPAANAWRSVDPKNPNDSDKDGLHDSLDDYANGIEATLTAAIVARVHSAITASHGWDWRNTVPTAQAYNDAFIELLKDDANTPAPQIDTPQTRVVPPDVADPLTEDKATAAWTGRTYQAKIPVWKLDDPDHGGDGDGIPTGYETYGYSWDGSKFVPWGFTLSGKSAYTAPTVGFEIVGTKLVPKDPAALDYTAQYFKTDHTQMSSDADPYSDKLESNHSNIPQTVKAPSDRPTVAAYPSIVGYMDDANVTIKQQITTTTGKKVTSGSASGGIGQASSTPKISVTGLVMGKSRPKAGIVGKGLDFADDKLVSAAYSKLSPTPEVGSTFPSLDINAKFGMTTEDWSQAVTLSTDQAAVLDFEAVLVNTGFANASKATPTFEVLIGDKVVGNIGASPAIDEIPAQGTRSFHTPQLPISLDQLKSYQSGAPVSLRLKQVDAELMVPQRDGETISYRDAGKWSPFSSAIDNSCARITVDMGDGTFATYPVMVGQGRPTLLDGLLWSLAEYQGGKYQGLSVPGFLPGKGDDKKVPSFADWMFCFDQHYPEADVAGYASIFDVPLVAGSHIYVRSKSAGDRPAVPWATISSKSGVTDDITNEDGKHVSAGVDVDMAIGGVWIAPTAQSTDRSQWAQLADADADGVWTADLPASWRVVAGQPVVVAQSATRWGDGTEGTSTVKTAAKATGFTGIRKTVTGTITEFPKHDLGLSKQILCFDLDGGTAKPANHDQWDGPPSGTDLSVWLYSNKKQHESTGEVFYTIEFAGFAEVYGSPAKPKWRGGESKWDTKAAAENLAAIKAADSQRSWAVPHAGIYEQALANAERFKNGDTVLLQTSQKRWVKWTITDTSYDTSTDTGGAGRAYSLQSVTAKTTAYDPGQ